MANFHVVPRGDGWAVKQEKAPYDSAVLRYQADAAKVARDLTSMYGGGEVVIHRPTGEIREKNTIGKNDPFPPRG